MRDERGTPGRFCPRASPKCLGRMCNDYTLPRIGHSGLPPSGGAKGCGADALLAIGEALDLPAPADAVLDTEGDAVFLVNGGDGELIRYDIGSGRTSRIGRRGSGPGEFGRPSGGRDGFGCRGVTYVSFVRRDEYTPRASAPMNWRSCQVIGMAWNLRSACRNRWSASLEWASTILDEVLGFWPGFFEHHGPPG